MCRGNKAACGNRLGGGLCDDRAKLFGDVVNGSHCIHTGKRALCVVKCNQPALFIQIRGKGCARLKAV